MRAAGLQGLLLAVLLGFVFPGVFLRGECIGPGDILLASPPFRAYAPEGYDGPANRLASDVIAAFIPYYALTEQALDAGEWPLWNPLEFAGMPLLANAQSAVFYPPRLLFRLFEIKSAFTLFILVKLWLCGMTMFLCARGLGCGLPAARFASAAWMLGGYNLIWCNWSLTDVAAWAPVLFLGVERVLARRYRSGFFAMALGGALLLLAGHPETAFGFAWGIGLYFALRLLFIRPPARETLRMLGVSAGAWLLALGAAAAQLLPFIEYLVHSETFALRAKHESANSLEIGALEFAGAFAARLFGTNAERNFFADGNSNFMYMMHPGIAVWLAAFLLFVRGGKRPGGYRVAAILLSASLGILLATRMSSLDFILDLPVFSSTIAVYHLCFAVLALPLLAAYGLERWWSAPRRARELLYLIPPVLVVILYLAATCAFYAGIIRISRMEEYVSRELTGSAVLAIAAVLLLALGTRLRPASVSLGLIVLLAAGQLYTVRGMMHTQPAQLLFPDTALTRYLQDMPKPVRIGAGEGFVISGVLAPYGVEDWLAYDGLYPERMMRFQKTLREEIWNRVEPITAKQYILYNPISADRPPFPLLEHPEWFTRVFAADALEVYKNNRAFPRAYVVGGLERVSSRDAIYDRMLAPDYDPARTVTALDTPDLAQAALPSTAARAMTPTDARVTERRSTYVAVEATTDQPAVLVLADAYFPGWTAALNGKDVPIFPAYDVFRGVLLPPGAHRVEFRYFPASFRWGLAISVLSLALSLGLAWRTRRAR